MITWEDFKKNKHYDISDKYQITDIICPECGRPVFLDTSIILPSYPPKLTYVCLFCDWTDYN